MLALQPPTAAQGAIKLHCSLDDLCMYYGIFQSAKFLHQSPETWNTTVVVLLRCTTTLLTLTLPLLFFSRLLCARSCS